MADYFAMLAAELAGVPYSKAAHRRGLIQHLTHRSEQSIEFKYANISAALIDLGFQYIRGYKPRSSYQGLLLEVVSESLASNKQLQSIAAVDSERPIVVPEVDNILSVVTRPPARRPQDVGHRSRQDMKLRVCSSVNYLEREARNRSLGSAGELFVLHYERARLSSLGKEGLAAKIEHTSSDRGDGAGFDILSYDETGAERLIEVKTTKYGKETPFYVSQNELAVSESEAHRYHLYCLFGFAVKPRLFTLPGALSATCRLSPSTYLAMVQ
ncbi:DUF3883 domain-containing protein [Synechococcus sp. L2F]|nr:DUF3883 domain-containing protein [Synechococcus sp. L2F]